MSLPQKFHLIGTLDEVSSDANRDAQSIPYGFLQLINAYTHRKKGAAIVRGGSLTETIAGSTLNRPLGMASYKVDTPTALMPVNIKYLANFAGVNWRLKSGSSWATQTVNANTSFSVSKQTQFAQLGSVLAIAGGKPARWNDGATNIEMIGYPAPSTAITFTNSAGSLSPIFGYQWIWTYYNSTTGKESDWSPVSANTSAQTSKQFTLTLPTTTPTGAADKKRIYRLADGGTIYRFVADITIATATYVDNTADTALGISAPTVNDNALPPTESYIIQKFAERFWLNDVSNPSQLAISKPFIGNNNDVEYFPVTSRLTFQHEITGLWVITAGMLVFGVRDITLLTGSDFSTFRGDPLKFNVGTQFANSIAGNGDSVVFLGENGFKQLVGGQVKHISTAIDNELRALLNDTYVNFIYVSATYNQALDQFIFCISASSSANTPWILDSSGALATWQLSTSGVTTNWIIPSAPTIGQAKTRVKIWGWCPTTDEWSEYRFPQCADNNAGGFSMNFLASPPPSSGALDPLQELTFMGVDGGANAGTIVGGWGSNYSKDDGAFISALALTSRIVPGKDDDAYRRFRHLGFAGSYSDISAHNGTVQYIKDFDDPQARDYSAALRTFSGLGDKRVFSDGKARFTHLLFSTTQGLAGDILCESFTVWYNETPVKEGR